MPTTAPVRDLADYPELAKYAYFADYMAAEYRTYCDEFRAYQRMGLQPAGEPVPFDVWLNRYEADYAWARA